MESLTGEEEEEYPFFQVCNLVFLVYLQDYAMITMIYFWNILSPKKKAHTHYRSIPIPPVPGNPGIH